VNDLSKNIKYEDYKQATDAAYKLGLLEGRAEVQNQMDGIQIQLANMFKTNKHLFRLLNEEYKKEKRVIRLSVTFVKHLLVIIGKEKKGRPLYYQCGILKKKYESATGKKFKV